jgi:hypothetical protein
MTALAPRIWRGIAIWFRAEIMILLAVILIALAVRLT